MKTLRLVAATALVSSVFALSASAAESEWWNVDFTSPTPNGVQLNVSELGALTNDAANMAAGTVQPYTNGVWSAVDSDESYVTNEFNPSGSFGGSNCLRLDTQGNDLTWTPDENLASNGVQTLVDADLYLVGSDSAPTDFDANNDVQAAIYLKNQTDDDSQETTNSVLCLYVYNSSTESNIWVDLAGVELTDQSWAHIQVKVDHSDATQPMVSVRVNDTQMYAVGNATATNWPAANNSTAKAAGRISSVAFRGTGAVDNFVGKTVVEEAGETYNFTAAVYCNNTLVGSGNDGNTTRIKPAEVGSGTSVEFDGFTFVIVDEQTVEPSNVLSRIEFLDPTDGTTVLTNFTYTFAYDATEGIASVTPDADDTGYVEFDEEGGYQTGPFSVTASNVGAVGDTVIVKIYFVDLNAPQPSEPTPVDPGQSLDSVTDADVIPAGVVSETDDGTGVTTDYFVVNFRAPEAGVTYTLMVSTDLTLTEDQWKGVGTGAATAATGDGTATSSAAGELITLKVPISGNAAFFKIKASK